MQVFEQIYKENGWRGNESVSGQGSSLAQTVVVRNELPSLVERLNITKLLDVPCGDYYWFQYIKFSREISYIGADVVPDLIRANIQQYGQDYSKHFEILDITKDRLPLVDLIMVRDLLGHFSNADVQRAVRNIKASGARYLLATTFPARETSGDIITGQWRPINLAHYFGLPTPIEIINEGCTEGNGAFSDKSLGLWDLKDLR